MPSSRTPTNSSTAALGLEQVLGMLPPRELLAIAEGVGVRLDRTKRIGAAAQLARGLLCLPEATDPSSLPPGARELLRRLIEARGVMVVAALPAAVGPLVARGLVFARATSAGAQLILPIAFLLQMDSWEGEDPRGVRSLLVQAAPAVRSAIASHYLGSSATNPLSLALETAWRHLTALDELQRALSELSGPEQRLLSSIEELGGEVDTEELLRLEREPMRLRGAGGATPSRRGVGFALERRGFLIPVHPNRHIIPTEVAERIGAERREASEARRAEIRGILSEDDGCPARAHFSLPPAPLAMAMASYVRDKDVSLKSKLGIPRSLLTRMASRFGREAGSVALLSALSRACGLWDASARHAHGPPGKLSLLALEQQLFEVWRGGGAWDEARVDGEVLRAAGAAREASVIRGVRALLLEGLVDLAEDRWVPWQAILEFVLADARAPGLARLLERWAERCGLDRETAALPRVIHRIVHESLPILGCVDIGEEQAEGGVLTWVRITRRGRAFVQGKLPPPGTQTQIEAGGRVQVGEELTVSAVLGLTTFAEVGGTEGQLELRISQSSLGSALGRGVSPEQIRSRLRVLGRLPDDLARLVSNASAVVGRAELVASPGFLWVDDPELREMLSTRRSTVDLFLDPSPPGGLLLAPNVELDRVVARCRALGVEVQQTGHGQGKLVVSAAPEADTSARSGMRRRVGGVARRRGGQATARRDRTS